MIQVAWDRVTRDNVLRTLSASIFIGAACFAFAADGSTNITVSGSVIDSACAYAKGLDKRHRRSLCQGMRRVAHQ
jgi:hypothetical protein